MTERVWQDTLDQRYRVRVDRLSLRSGQLTVKDDKTGQTLVDRVVHLSYGAVFGPDVADVDEWQRITETAIQNPRPLPTDYLWPPKDWSPVEAAYALAARHYWRLKAADMGLMPFEVEPPLDLASELTIISNLLRAPTPRCRPGYWKPETVGLPKRRWKLTPRLRSVWGGATE